MIRILLISCLLILFYGIKSFSQPVSIALQDKITRQPIPYAYVMVRETGTAIVSTLLSDENGVVSTVSLPPLIITVKSLGYKEMQDTIYVSGRSVMYLSPRYYELDQVVVTGQFRTQAVDQSIYKVNVIDSRQIRIKGSNNMGDLLRTEPGFQFHSEGILGEFVRIKGLSGEYIKVLIDGMPVAGRIGDRIDLGQISLQNIDHIEIIEGPISVVYGSNALGGAINLITSDAKGKRLSTSVDAHYETAGIYDFTADFAGQHNASEITFNAARNFFKGWGTSDTIRYKILKPKLQYLLGGSYRYKKSNLSIQFTTDILIEELRDQDSLSLSSLYEKALDGYHYTKRWNNRFNLTREFDNSLLLNIQTGYSWYRKSKITYLNDLVNLRKSVAAIPELHDTTVFSLVSSRIFLSKKTNAKFEYQSGLDLNYESANGKRTKGFKEITDIAAFVNIIYYPVSWLSFQPGMRFIYNSKYKAPIVYALNVKYNKGNLILYGSYGKGFRAPSLKQLYLQFIDSNHEIVGNMNLKAETAHDISISSTYTFPHRNNSLRLDASLFYNSIDNAIQLAIDTLRPGWGTYFNIEGDAFRTKGIEAKVRYNIYPGIILNAGFVTTGRKRLEKNRLFDYTTDATAGLSYRNEKHKYELSLFYKYTDRYLEYAGNYSSDGQLNGIAERFIKDYHTFDVTLYKQFFGDRLIVTGGVKNLFNVTLVESYGNLNFHGSSQNSVAAGYGRSFFLKVSYLFEKI